MIGKVCPGHDIRRLQGIFQSVLCLLRRLFILFFRLDVGGGIVTTTVLHIPRGGLRDVLRTSLEL